jgi:hypothetical protein
MEAKEQFLTNYNKWKIELEEIDPPIRFNKHKMMKTQKRAFMVAKNKLRISIWQLRSLEKAIIIASRTEAQVITEEQELVFFKNRILKRRHMKILMTLLQEAEAQPPLITELVKKIWLLWMNSRTQFNWNSRTRQQIGSRELSKKVILHWRVISRN